VKDLLDYLHREWATLSGAPFTFFTAMLLACGVALAIARWRYETLLDNIRDRLEAQRERAQIKDEQLAEYRQRLNLVPRDTTAFSQLTDAELQKRAIEVVANLRQFVAERNSRLVGNVMARSSQRKMTQEELLRLHDQETNAIIQQSLKTAADYEQQFKTDTILLRDELLSRLPPTPLDVHAKFMFESPTNRIGMGMVADELDRLAKSIPVGISKRDV
jgi:hypothetical protein